MQGVCVEDGLPWKAWDVVGRGAVGWGQQAGQLAWPLPPLLPEQSALGAGPLRGCPSPTPPPKTNHRSQGSVGVVLAVPCNPACWLQIAKKKAGMPADVAKALARVSGGLYIVTAAHTTARSAMVASWVSQASFEPLGLTIAVAKDRAIESLMQVGVRVWGGALASVGGGWLW